MAGHHHHDHHGAEHHHHHHHSHAPPTKNRRILALVILLNLVFVGIEFSYGFIAHSTALLADAGHNVSDVLALLMTWGAYVLANKKPSQRFTYGLRSSTILAALVNSMLLLVACGAIAVEAVHRFTQPAGVAGLTVSVVAAAGLVVNGLSALLLMKGNKDDLNIRGAFLHMLADAAVSLTVMIVGMALIYTDWYWLDPLVSLVIVLVIFIGTWNLLREGLGLALNAVPHQINVGAINSFLRQLHGVKDVHDLHIWGLSTTENALTAHLVMPDGHPGDEFIDKVAAKLKHDYAVHHTTLQIELGSVNHDCALVAGSGRPSHH